MIEPLLTLLDGVRYGGQPVPGERSHALLAALALAAPRAVSTQSLVEQVWPDGEPDHPEKALQVLVSRTRTRTSAETVVHEGTGYRLGLREDQVDALHLSRLLREATQAKEAGDLDVVRHTSRDALTMTVGNGPLSGQARSQQTRAKRLLGGVLLVRGEAAEALRMLESALEADPRDEALMIDLLKAEAATKGVPTALKRYADFAERTLDEVGAEPSEPLRRLHLELLARDAPIREGLKYDASPMIGRDEAVADLRALLSTSRVVSLVGAGGLGKTRTAHLVGRLAQQPLVHFVELAGVNAPEGVLPEVASALGVREAPTLRPGQRGTDLRARLGDQLSGAPTLLILDNCEHVISAVADLVAFLVATTAATTVLTTSRAPLGITGEQVYLLPQLGEDEAVELFEQRARAARSGVRLDRAEVRELVTRLDGLPLAIELAAAKVRAMSVADITRRLSDRFALLTGRDRSAPDRHQTLEAVIDWSWNLLREEDRQALMHLSVFPDGFSFDGAEAVLRRDPLPSLTELLDQSLLVVREGDRVRYRFLETVREYGQKQLGGGHEARERLKDWAIATARTLGPGLHTGRQVEVMHETRAEAGNLSALLRTALAEHDADTAVPLIGLLAGFWMIEGDHLTVLGLAGPVLDLVLQAEPTDEQAAVIALLTVNQVIFRRSPRPEALARLQGQRTPMAVLLQALFVDGGSLDALAADPDPQVRVAALQWRTREHENDGDLATALATGKRALAACDDVHDDGPWNRALIMAQLAEHAFQVGEWELCMTMGTAAQRIMQELGALTDSLQIRSLLALAELSQGRVAQARAAFDAISTAQVSDTGFEWSINLLGHAELAFAEGDVEQGLALYDQCLNLARTQVHEPFASLWVLFAESAALFVAVLHGHRERAEGIADTLRPRVTKALTEEGERVDYPMLGAVLLALGAWDLDDDPRRARTALALAQRFGYQRMLPSMAWVNAVRLAGPGLDELVATYDDRLPAQLHEEAVKAISG